MFVMLRVTLSAFLGTGLLGGSAMGLADIVRGAVAIANKSSGSLQVEVSHEAWIGDDSYSKPQYATAVGRQALAQEGGKPWRAPNGDTITPKATISFLEPIEGNGAAGRTDPIDPRDRFTLPDGKTGPVVEKPAGLLDPSTGAGYLHEVYLV